MDVSTFLTQVIGELAQSEPTIEKLEGVFNVRVTGKVAHVIGKEGKTIEAIRTIAKAIGDEGTHQVKITVNAVSDRA